MFTSKQQLIKKSGKKGVDRFEFLQELVNEFHQSSSLESQEQVLANLANFAYDPLNYFYLRELEVIELFVKGLSSVNSYIKLYSIKGLCNLSNDPLNQEIIIRYRGIDTIISLLTTENDEFIASAIATLMFFMKTSVYNDFQTPIFLSTIKSLTKRDNQVLRNLALVYLEDCCAEKVE